MKEDNHYFNKTICAMHTGMTRAFMYNQRVVLLHL